MSAAALLSELRRRDIQLQAVGSELRCSAPAGALTAELREQLRRHKEAVLQLLAAAQRLTAEPHAIVPLQAGGSRAPIFAVPGHNGDVFCYRALARSLGDDQPFFGLQPPGADGRGEPLRRVEDIAGRFAEQLRAFRPHGACVIAGFCAGGTVAFELAQQLLSGGADIRFVALFGSPYPEYFRRREQPWARLVDQAARAGKHAHELASRSWGERRRYLAAELHQWRVRRSEARAAARDPVLALRAGVERATLSAVARYSPRRFAGRLKLFLPGGEWLGSGVSALRWRELAERTEAYVGPDASGGADMLRGPHAAAIAELVRRCCESAA